jgi:hypothetical protein
MMFDLPVNPVAIILGGVAYMIIGMVWYSPLLFGNTWTKEMGFTDKKIKSMKSKNMGATYAASFVAALFQAFMLAFLYTLFPIKGIIGGVSLGLWIWAGFIAMSMLTTILFEQRSIKLYAINVGYHLATIVATGALIGFLS